MILVGQYDSFLTRRVAVTLNHYHMPFKRDTRSVFGNAKDIAKINPLIRIPALILEDGEVLIESTAIIDYLDERAGPHRALVPPHGPERRKILQAVALASGTGEKAGAIVYEKTFHGPKQQSKEWLKRCEGQLKAGLEELERRCGNPWFFDTRMSHADVMTGCVIGYIKLRVPEAFPPDKYMKLHALARHCELTEDFADARIGADEKMPAKAT
jgi:glutathione S-transferase